MIDYSKPHIQILLHSGIENPCQEMTYEDNIFFTDLLEELISPIQITRKPKLGYSGFYLAWPHANHLLYMSIAVNNGLISLNNGGKRIYYHDSIGLEGHIRLKFKDLIIKSFFPSNADLV